MGTSARLSFLLITILLISACEKEIPYDGQVFEPALVVNGFITDQSAVKLRVSISQGILDNSEEFEYLNNCEIQLYENDNLVGSTTNGTIGNYTIPYACERLNNYRVEVAHPDFPNVSASTIIPDSINNLTASGIITNENMEMTVNWQDLPGVKYYQLYVLAVYTQNGDTSLIDWTTTSPYLNENTAGDSQENFYANALFLDDQFANGEAEIKLKSFYYNNNPDVEYYVLLLGCSEDYYLYYKTKEAYQNSQDGLFAQPVQIFTNVEEGLGIFGGYSKTYKKVEF